MEPILFNINDLALVFTVLFAVFFSILSLIIDNKPRVSNYYLAAFLLAFSMYHLNTLLVFGQYVRDWALSYNPDLLLTFLVGYWLVGPLLYFYTRSLTAGQQQLKLLDNLHFLPAALYILYLYFVYYRLADQIQIDLITSYTIQSSNHFTAVLFLQCMAVSIYATLCITRINQFRTLLTDQFSSIEARDLRWLQILLYGFLVTFIFRQIAIFVVYSADIPKAANIIGIVLNYIDLTICIFLVTFYLKQNTKFIIESISDIQPQSEPKIDSGEDQTEMEKIETQMLAKKPFLDPELTLQQLSDIIGLPAKVVSNTINREYKQNFYEFVNAYRINEAKELLADQSMRRVSITDIYLRVGFNTRSVFNTFFKKHVGKTPSQFRRELGNHAKSNIVSFLETKAK